LKSKVDIQDYERVQRARANTDRGFESQLVSDNTENSISIDQAIKDQANNISNTSILMDYSFYIKNTEKLNASVGPEELERYITSIGQKAESSKMLVKSILKSDVFGKNILNKNEDNFSNTEDIEDFNEYNKECLKKLKSITHVPSSSLKYHYINYKLDKTKCKNTNDNLIKCFR